MNTEPPEGDDLQRMLVSMKQNVLERADARPKRRRGRSGVVIGVVAMLTVGTATGAVALTLSQQETPVAAPTQTQEPEPSPTATIPSSAPITGTPIPTATPTPGPISSSGETVSIPGWCSQLVPTSSYERFFGAASLYGEVRTDTEAREPTAAERTGGITDLGASLFCQWDNKGVSEGLVINILRVTPAEAVALEQRAVVQSGQCADHMAGRMCQYEFRAPDGVLHAYTTFVRDGISVQIYQYDFPTTGLLDAVVEQIWEN